MAKEDLSSTNEKRKDLPKGHWVDDSPEVFQTKEDVEEMERMLEKLKEEKLKSGKK